MSLLLHFVASRQVLKALSLTYRFNTLRIPPARPANSQSILRALVPPDSRHGNSNKVARWRIGSALANRIEHILEITRAPDLVGGSRVPVVFVE